MIDEVLKPRVEYWGAELNVISIGCDVKFGRDVKAYCQEKGIKFLEFVVYFNGPRDKTEYTDAYLARHQALLALGHEYHIVVSNNRRSNVEDLVSRVQISLKPFALYDESCQVIEVGNWDNAAPSTEETQALAS